MDFVAKVVVGSVGHLGHNHHLRQQILIRRYMEITIYATL